MSTVRDLSTENLASLLGTKGGGDLQAFFAPGTSRLSGTEKPGSIGRTIMGNLLHSPFGPTVFPVNPKRQCVLEVKAHPRIGDVPEPIDLAIVATPAPDGAGPDCRVRLCRGPGGHHHLGRI